MVEFPSEAARLRSEGAYQIDQRREHIVTAAQRLFLDQGLEATSMRQIADRAAIAPVTLYRYFPDRHPLAVEVAARMMDRILMVSNTRLRTEAGTGPYAPFGELCIAMIDRFYQLRDAYCYIGMFDTLYSRAYPSRELATYYLERMRAAIATVPGLAVPLRSTSHESGFNRDAMMALVNVIMSFMEKMAARGALMGREQKAPLSRQLSQFRGFVVAILQSEFGWNGNSRSSRQT